MDPPRLSCNVFGHELQLLDIVCFHATPESPFMYAGNGSGFCSPPGNNGGRYRFACSDRRQCGYCGPIENPRTTRSNRRRSHMPATCLHVSAHTRFNAHSLTRFVTPVFALQVQRHGRGRRRPDSENEDQVHMAPLRSRLGCYSRGTALTPRCYSARRTLTTRMEGQHEFRVWRAAS